MPTRILSFFPDTNLFIQCLSLEELDWSEWIDFEEVHLIVCRTVQWEMDQQKNRGNDRVAQRARKTSSLFRSIVEEDYKVIREKGPQVKLMLESFSVPSPELKDRLDYNKPDDEIVGLLHQYKQQHPEADVRLLTHDTGPMMTARSLNLPFVKIKDTWLLQPESNETERENRRLKEEITRLRKTEPEFHIRCLDNDESEIDTLEVKCPFYEPLNEHEISAFIDQLKNRFPIVTNFDPLKRIDKSSTFGSIIATSGLYTPPSESDIAKYRDEEYPAWIEDCKNVLSNLHKALLRDAESPAFRFVVTNEGSRPGKNALVVITSRGQFKICPPQPEDDEHSKRRRILDRLLPIPPTPPKRRRITDWDYPFLNDPNSLFYTPPSLNLDMTRFLSRDPDAFSYKPDRPDIPVESFSLECEQWRHGIAEECFEGEIFAANDQDEIQGAIECEIHAENLSSPAKKIVPVKITIKRESTKDYASNLVMKLSSRSSLRNEVE